VGTGLGTAIVCGIIWGLVRALPFFFFSLLLGAGVGYAIGEVISLSVSRKRGAGLAVIAGIMVAIGYLISIVSPWGLAFTLYIPRLALDLLALALGIYIAIRRFR